MADDSTLRFIQLIDHTIGAVLIIISLAILCIQFARKKTRYMGPMILTWASVMAMTVFATIYIYITPDMLDPDFAGDLDIWFYLQTIFAVLAGFFYINLVDSISRETVEPIKLSLFSSYVGISLYVLFTNPDEMRDFFFYGIQAIMGLIWFYYCVRIRLNAPTSLKSYATLNLLGSCNVFVAITFGISGFTKLLPGIEWVVASLGIMCTTIAFIKREQLAFLLPFRALRLTVMHMDGGIPVFNYTWKSGQHLIDEYLFTGMIQGLRLILRESVLRGEFRDITLDEASIIVNRVKDSSVMSILVCMKTSRVLRLALSTFTKKFVEKYQTAIKNPADSSQFEGAENLVHECFNFLPDFD